MKTRNLVYIDKDEVIDRLLSEYRLIGYVQHPGMEPLKEKQWNDFHSSPHYSRNPAGEGRSKLVIMARSPKPPMIKEKEHKDGKRR